MKSDVGTEDDKMNNEGEQQVEDSGSSNKKKYIIIAAVAGGIILIVAIVLIVVFVTKGDDSSSIELDSTNTGEDSITVPTFTPISWTDAKNKARSAIENFSNQEKFYLLYGIDNLVNMWNGVCVGMIEPPEEKTINNFRGMCLQDGPAGVRTSKNTTSWQAQINLAATFNRTLWTQYGVEYGKEFVAKGINVALGPAMNIMRNPKAGRVWESYSDDPFLSGEEATVIIKAIQSTGVIACAKHYVANDQETNRKNSTSNVKDQALYEIYLEPFYRSVVDADVGSIMSSYNDVNGVHLSINSRLLQDILKNEFGFQGFVMSDWWAQKSSDGVDGFINGEDMNMPGGIDEGETYKGRDKSYWSDYHTKVGDEIPLERLDDAVVRVLSSMYRFGQLDGNYPQINLDKPTISGKSKKVNREAAGQSNVLLKNGDGTAAGRVLPITNTSYPKIAIIGNDAFPTNCHTIGDCSCGYSNDHPYRYFHGHLALGYGSGTTTFSYLIDPLAAITERAEKDNITIVSAGENTLYKSTETKTGTTNTSKTFTFNINVENTTEAVKLLTDTNNTDIKLILVFIMADSGEEYVTLEKSIGDRFDLDAWHGGNELVEAVVANKGSAKVVVVINSPGPINVDSWLDRVDGVIFSGLGGAESGHGLADVLFGDLNPSGHLPYVWGKVEDYHAVNQYNILDTVNNRYGGDIQQYEYEEGLFVGQRYFDKERTAPQFPFGYGLSYTTFEIPENPTATFDSSKKSLKVKFNVKNSGDLDGDAVPMLFLDIPKSDNSNYPKKLFKGFEKVFIRSGDIKEVEIIIDKHGLSYYDSEVTSGIPFTMDNGTYKAYIGFDARDSNMKAVEITIP